MTPLSALAAHAAAHHHVISTAELRSLGFSKDAIRHLVATKRLFRLHRGVYVFGRRDLSREGRWYAAVAASPARAALGIFSAAVLLELLTEEGDRPHVMVPMRCSRQGPAGVVCHRSTTITEDDIEVRSSIRVTTVLRTLSDLALTRLHDRTLHRAVRQAGRLHHADLQQLRGKPRLDKIVRLYDPLIGMTESEMEAIFLGLCARFRLPTPLPQVHFGPFRADFTWHSHRLVVEVDSRRWHGNDVNRVTDVQKERHIRRTGYEVLRFTWAELVHTPAAVAAEIRAELRRREHLVGS
jgi:very-short-patch-repair endonuclease